MTRRASLSVRLCAVAPIALAAIGCDASRSPAGPGPTTTPPPVVRTYFQEVPVLVYDGLNRPVRGALVKVLGGSSDGTFDVTDDFGRARLIGPFEPVPITLSATAEEATVTQTVTIRPRSWSPEPYAVSEAVVLWVQSTEVADLALGGYTVTFSAESDCPTIPTALRSRTYGATLSEGMFGRVVVTLTGGDFVESWYDSLGRFDILVAGKEIGLFYDGDGPLHVAERVAPHALLTVTANGSVRVEESRPAVVVMPVAAILTYCEVEPGKLADVGCRPPGGPPAVRFDQCIYSGSMTLRRR